MVDIPERIQKYIIKGRIRTISKRAPDDIKREAMDIDSDYFRFSGKHIFEMEDNAKEDNYDRKNFY